MPKIGSEFDTLYVRIMENNGWLPKETAPKDGSWFLVYVSDSPMAWAPYEFAAWQTVHWHKFNDRSFDTGIQSYFGGTDTSEEIDFDWWQPLPKEPACIV